jgi:hypothetical protein
MHKCWLAVAKGYQQCNPASFRPAQGRLPLAWSVARATWDYTWGQTIRWGATEEEIYEIKVRRFTKKHICFTLHYWLMPVLRISALLTNIPVNQGIFNWKRKGFIMHKKICHSRTVYKIKQPFSIMDLTCSETKWAYLFLVKLALTQNHSPFYVLNFKLS